MSQIRIFDAGTGAPLSTIQGGGFDSAILNGPLLVTDQFQDDEIRLYSVAVSNGTDSSKSTKVQPAVADGVVHAGSGDGYLRAFAAGGCGSSFCTPLFATTTGSAITGAPAVAQGHLVVGTADGKIHAYALPRSP